MLNYKIPQTLIDQINQIKNKHNPVVQNTTTTGVRGLLMRAYNNRNDSDESELFFEIAADLYKMVYIKHIGSGIFYDFAYYTDAMTAYVEEARPIIESYIENRLWTDICDSYSEEE